MRKALFLAGACLSVLLTVPVESRACGESMFRIGKGVHYRSYSAPIPGTVLVYARTTEERAIAEQLRLAGHQVLVVETDLELSLELKKRDIDVILAPVSKRGAVEAGITDLDTVPQWVPASAQVEVPPTAQPMEGKGVSEDGALRDYLKAIHKTLKKRRT